MFNTDMIYEAASPYIGGVLGVILGAIGMPLAMESKVRKLRAILGCMSVMVLGIFLFGDLDPHVVFELTGYSTLETIWGLSDTAKYGALGVLVAWMKWGLDKLPNRNKNKGESK